jgi:CRISPR-associated protein Cas1
MRVSKPEIRELPRLEDRASFVYLERCTINVSGGAIIAYREGQKISIPSCSIAAVIIGPGVSMTTDAVRLLAQGSTPIVWMSSDETRFYAYGRPLSSSSRWLIQQAKIVSQEHLRLQAAKTMYNWRFDDDVSSLTMAQLRSIEGRRMLDLYKRLAKEHGFTWSGRRAELDLQGENDRINYALTIGNQILYAIHLAITLGIGLAPGLGIVHNGRDNAFIFDISDLYKAKTSIPIAFDIGADQSISQDDIDGEVRKRIRESVLKNNVLKDSIDKIFLLLNAGKHVEEGEMYSRAVWIDEGLWTPDGIYSGSVNYGSRS